MAMIVVLDLISAPAKYGSSVRPWVAKYISIPLTHSIAPSICYMKTVYSYTSQVHGAPGRLYTA